MLAIYGAGGFALQMLDTIEARREGGADVCFVSDTPSDDIAGIPVLAPQDVPKGAEYCIAIAGSATRRKLASGLDRFATLIASSAIVSPHSEIGEGSIIAHRTIIEAKARIGRHFHANIMSYVAHECTIGDYVTFAPSVNCNGNVTIGDGAYIGTGAFIKQGLTIGEGAVIGMGAVVTKDVPAGETWVGNPAKAR